jgi:hypothetical protein
MYVGLEGAFVLRLEGLGADAIEQFRVFPDIGSNRMKLFFHDRHQIGIVAQPTIVRIVQRLLNNPDWQEGRFE